MTDAPPTTGLHHVTNICTDMKETGEFYGDALGWHTVKRTRNYDDPGPAVASSKTSPSGPGFGVGEEPGSEEIDPFEGGER